MILAKSFFLFRVCFESFSMLLASLFRTLTLEMEQMRVLRVITMWMKHCFAHCVVFAQNGN